ncbi:MAG TPA: hypothetical protein VLF94_03525 [Chlamydiales bacterium]|nr:hypothetical protein [Chlamydiales bacterium]
MSIEIISTITATNELRIKQKEEEAKEALIAAILANTMKQVEALTNNSNQPTGNHTAAHSQPANLK